jgi:hypothetical protein
LRQGIPFPLDAVEEVDHWTHQADHLKSGCTVHGRIQVDVGLGGVPGEFACIV